MGKRIKVRDGDIEFALEMLKADTGQDLLIVKQHAHFDPKEHRKRHKGHRMHKRNEGRGRRDH